MTVNRSSRAAVVGSGPNGLAAAITLARAGVDVTVYEGADTIGGGCRSADLTLPGFHHDVCSAVHPLLVASPFFNDIDLQAHGVRLLWPEVELAHPLPDGRAGTVVRSVDDTAAGLLADGAAYRALFGPLVRDADAIVPAVLAPLRSVPTHPVKLGRFGARGLLPVSRLLHRFHGDDARALIAGVAAHSMLPLDAPLSSAFALLLTTLAHSAGWPVVEGGSGRVTAALTKELESLGGQFVTGCWVRSLSDLGDARVVMLDVSPDQILALGGNRLSSQQRRALNRYRYGPGVCKVDWALSGPVPWTAEACRRTCTVHVGGTFAEVARSEAAVNAGVHPEHPFCIVTQPAVVDRTRAPAGMHTLWAYCHVPGGSTVDMTERIETQIERFAPGFRDLVLHRTTKTARDVSIANPTYVGGDINGGAASLRQTLFRPTVRWNPYRTGIPGIYLCSASAPPGGGVHGMCGVFAAKTALGDLG